MTRLPVTRRRRCQWWYYLGVVVGFNLAGLYTLGSHVCPCRPTNLKITTHTMPHMHALAQPELEARPASLGSIPRIHSESRTSTSS
jgi:hypothetical protein